MEIKKEVQETILPQNNKKATEEEFYNILKTIAPGTNLRTALDGALKTGKGALVAIENELLLPLIDGGFRINAKFTPQRLIELTKMDGAIILSKDMKRINYSNVLLTPNSKIKSVETGTRHKAAERTAKQTGTLVIAISERKNEITLYYKNIRCPIIGTGELLIKANENIQMLEKQRELFDNNIEKLNHLELRNYQSLNQALSVIQKGRIIQKISSDLKKYLIELGKEGTLIKSRLKEITSDVEKETDFVIKDYTKLDLKKSKMMIESLTFDEISEKENILQALAYEKPVLQVPLKGWRILSKTSLLEADIASIIKEAETIGKAIHSNHEFYKRILGDEKAGIFKEEINRVKLNS